MSPLAPSRRPRRARQLTPAQHHAVFQGCDVTYVPIFLGGLMKACGNTAPINITSTYVGRGPRALIGATKTGRTKNGTRAC